MAAHREIALLLDLLDEAFNRKSWHGTNLRGAVRGLNAAQAAWRSTRHSIAEIVLHCAYWKYTVWRKLTGQKRGAFPRKGSNWFALPAPDERAWKAAVTLLDEQHAQLRAAIVALSPQRLHAPPALGATSTLMRIRGVALHDVYHAGQIQVIKKAHG